MFLATEDRADHTGRMTDEPMGDKPDRRWGVPEFSTPTIVGVLAGVAFYLIVIVSGQLGIGIGIALVLLLAVSLIRTIRQTRTTRQRLREGERPGDQR